MNKKFSILKYTLIPMLMIIGVVSLNQTPALADARYWIINDIYPEYLREVCEDDGKLYLPINESIYYKHDGGFEDASYRLEISNQSVVEQISAFGLKGKKKGTAVITVKKYEDGKYTVLHQIQVVVGQPRFYTREINISLDGGLPVLKDPDVLLGVQYFDTEYSYTYRPHDTSVIKKKGTSKDDFGKKFDLYRAANFGSTKVDIIEKYKGKETVIDTITVNVRKPELRYGDGDEIIHSKAHPDDFYLNIPIDYLCDESEISYEIDDPSIINKKQGEKFQLLNCGTTNMSIYCKVKGEKYRLGTVKVTIVP